MIRPTAAQRRRLKHERYLREIRENNLAITNTRFLVESMLNFDPEKRTIATDMPFDEIRRRFCR
ncbi:hypothetical protein LNAOJCKE_0381 [Methylorubrum aminovorans]|uniref:Uncharacterized protein n=1 Tax=Methylorubrum aminovorans TaxID=269069 RepID=A0ABQ4U9Q8_9HYPH|nr:hypothetical protein [Methylorubrum aminovorans]GJE63187.1 hypothetical protein LNAOJCKE_0381 [Methylorubrum aminovorans]GMA79231.1 hypothetical protein GCM10025880_56480 [Methylorubrum aminovorans]